MEETVGFHWHQWLARKTQPEKIHQIEVQPLLPKLNRFWQLLNPDANHEIQLSPTRNLGHHGSIWRRLYGQHSEHLASWYQGTLHLPTHVASYSNPFLNQQLPLFWVAMASQFESTGNWLLDNAQAQERALRKWLGLKPLHQQIVKAEGQIRRRKNQDYSNDAEAAQNHLIMKALSGQAIDLKEWPVGRYFPFPVQCWLYPAPAPEASHRNDDGKDPVAPPPGLAKNGKTNRQKKTASRIEQQREQQGLILFRLENLFTVQEWLQLDRPEEDGDDDQQDQTASDLDKITLSKSWGDRGAKIKMDLDLPAPDVDDLPLSEGTLFPEWQEKTQSYLPNHCRVIPMLARDTENKGPPTHLKPLISKVTRQFRQWKNQQQKTRFQLEGDELDVQLYSDLHSQPIKSDTWPVFQAKRNVRPERCLLLLADTSQSTEAYVQDRPVIEAIKDGLTLFAEAMAAADERFSLYSFSSIRRRHVRFNLIKNFNEPWSNLTYERVAALKPGYYTRMGAAIRQATAVLKDQEQTQKMLLLLTDGKPNDIDHYEHRHGLADTRKAIEEARDLGILVFTITLDPEAEDYAPFLFGSRFYQLVTKNTQLADLLPQIAKRWTTS